jgi:hypothetical protein
VSLELGYKKICNFPERALEFYSVLLANQFLRVVKNPRNFDGIGKWEKLTFIWFFKKKLDVPQKLHKILVST